MTEIIMWQDVYCNIMITSKIKWLKYRWTCEGDEKKEN